MADKVVLEAEVKSNIGEVSKDASGLASEFKVMGVSLNDVKAGFVSVGRTAKASFGSIKAGLISTGIGAFIVAIGSLVAWFTKTKKGAETLERVFAGIGATVNVIVDRLSKFGGAIVKLFQGDAKGALQDVKGAFTGIGAEITNDLNETIKLKKAFQELRDSERDLNVETAQRRADIEDLKLIAEDVTKSEKERLAAAQTAFRIENDLLARRIKNAEESLRIQREEMALGENMEEDLDKEAELLINLANIRGESATKQIELNNKINAIQAEGRAADAEREADLIKMPALFTETNEKLITADESYTKKVMDNAKKRTDYQKLLQREQLNAAGQFAGALSSLAGENKQLAAAEALINTYLAVTEVMKDKTIPSTTLKFLMAGTVLASGLANVKKIYDTDVGGGGGGGAVPGATPNTPAPEMMSGAFTLGGGMKPEPARAYVVSDDITNNQDKLAIIRRRATI